MVRVSLKFYQIHFESAEKGFICECFYFNR